MQSSHAAGRVSARFDDPNLIAYGGLVPLVRLAERCGLPGLVTELVHLPASANGTGAFPASKVMALVAGMAAGADSIDDMDRLRHGAMNPLFSEVRAPSTLGSSTEPDVGPPPDWFAACAVSGEPILRRIAASWPGLSAELVETLAKDDDEEVRIRLACHHPLAPPHLLLDVFVTRPVHRPHLLTLPRFPPAGRAHLIGHPDPEVRSLAVADPALSTPRWRTPTTRCAGRQPATRTWRRTPWRPSSPTRAQPRALRPTRLSLLRARTNSWTAVCTALPLRRGPSGADRRHPRSDHRHGSLLDH
jgi:hypothetical protein